MQEQRDVEQRAVPRLDLVRISSLASGVSSLRAALDVGKDADAAQQMLVHRVVVVHVELHHRDDAGRRRGTKRPSTPASFIRRSTVSASFFEVRISRKQLGCASSLSRNFASIRLSERVDRAHRVGMEREIVLLREMKDADQVDRIALEDVLRRARPDAVVVDDEILALDERAARRAAANCAIMRLSTGTALGVAVFQLGAQDAR